MITAEQLKGMTPDQIAKLINEMSAKRNTLSFKVGEKGGISVYGLNARFPVTLFIQQWERLIAVIPELQAFAKANEAKLTRKA